MTGLVSPLDVFLAFVLSLLFRQIYVDSLRSGDGMRVHPGFDKEAIELPRFPLDGVEPRFYKEQPLG